MGVVAFGDGWVDLDSGTIHRMGRRMELSPIETALLRRLAASSPQPVCRDELLRDVWGYSATARTDTLKTTVRRVRTKLGEMRTMLTTARGRGYGMKGADGAPPPSGQVAILSLRAPSAWGSPGSVMDRLLADRPCSGFTFFDDVDQLGVAFADVAEAYEWAEGIRAVAEHAQGTAPAVGLAIGPADPPDYRCETRRRSEMLAELAGAGGFRCDPEAGVDDAPERTWDPADEAAELARRRLPARVDPFVGRQPVLASLTQALEAYRLVTLWGPGGSGKTRLALERCHLDPGGVVWVDLVPVSSRSQILASVADGLKATSSDEKAVRDALVENAPLRLVLDNCEHVIDDVAGLASDWLRTCPELSILATSREPLRVAGEFTLPVDPMDPSDAVALLRSRAAAQGVAQLSDDSGLRAIAQAVDCLPLAVELVAPKLRTMSVPDVLEALRSPLEAVASRRRDAPERHRSLVAVLDWSWRTLDPALQSGLSQLSVFRGGFTAESARAVVRGCGAAPELLDRLHEQAWVHRVAGESGPARFDMLVTTRAFAADRLEDERGVQYRHLRHFVTPYRLDEDGHTDPRNPPPPARIVGVANWPGCGPEDRDNVWQAYDNAIAMDLPEAAACCTLAAFPLVLHQVTFDRLLAALESLPDDLPTWLDLQVGFTLFLSRSFSSGSGAAAGLGKQLLDHEGLDEQPKIRAQLHTELSGVLADVGEAELGDRLGEASVELARACDWVEGEMSALRKQAHRAARRGDFELASQLARGVVERARNEGLTGSWLPFCLGLVAEAEAASGRYESSIDQIAQAVEVAQQSEQWVLVGRLLGQQAWICWLIGRLDEAETLYSEAHQIAVRLGHTGQIASNLLGLADVYTHQGRTGLARQRVLESRGTAERRGGHIMTALCDEVLGQIEALDGDPAEAIRLLASATERIRESGGREVVGSLGAWAWARLLSGDPSGARDLADEALALTDLPLSVGHCCIVRAAAGCSLGELDQARADLATARDTPMAAADAALADCIEAEAAWRSGEREQAFRAVERAAELATRMGAGRRSLLGLRLAAIEGLLDQDRPRLRVAGDLSDYPR